MLRLIVAALMAASALASPARATIQDDMLCWEPDIEFPVPCDESDG